jgi:Uma2 family endonuclease
VDTIMSTSIAQSSTDRNLYPDDDGNPMAENTLQFKWIVLVKEGLETVFRDDPNVFVAGDLLWYAEEGNPKVRTAPDALVVFGRPKGYRGSYKQWEEGGIPPQVVFEILSPGNRGGEMLRKFRFYDDRGVEEYYIYDPEDGSLSGWRREGAGRLDEIDEMRGYVSPRLGVRFEPGDGPDNLKIYAPDGSLFKTYQEIRDEADAANQRADEAVQRAEAERLRAEAESQRAEAERLRAERLAARLRELGETLD